MSSDVDEFAEILTEYFGIDIGMVQPESLLIEDLAFDSLMLYECRIMVEEAGDRVIADESFLAVRTVRDLHLLYLQVQPVDTDRQGSVNPRLR